MQHLIYLYKGLVFLCAVFPLPLAIITANAGDVGYVIIMTLAGWFAAAIWYTVVIGLETLRRMENRQKAILLRIKK